MTFTTFKTNRELDIDELKEIMSLMENQETTDRYTNESLHIDGNYAEIDVEIDEDGNVTLLQKRIEMNMKNDLIKDIHWYYEDKKYNGYARLRYGEENMIVLCDSYEETFDSIFESEITNGFTIEELFDEIPEDVTDFEL